MAAIVAAAGRRRIVDATTIFRGAGGAGACAGRRVGSMRDALLDRDAELAALARRLAVARAGAGRVIVVEGPAGIGKSSLLAAVAGGAEARRGRPCCERAAVRSSRTPPGVSPASCSRRCARARRGSELAVGAAGAGTARARSPTRAEPAHAGDAMHAAAHGLTWLAGNLADRAPALLVVDDVHWADAPSLRWLAQLARRLDGLALGVLCASAPASRRPQPDLLAELLAAAPEPPLRPRPLGPAAAEALVARAAARRRAERSRTPATPSPAATRSCSAPCSAHLAAERRRADRRGRGAVERVRARAGRPQRRAPARPATHRRRRARPRVRRARPRRAAPARVPRSPRSTRRPARGWPTGCAPPGCSTATAIGSALVHPLSRARSPRACGRASARSGTPARRGCSSASAPTPKRVALHLLHAEPGRRAGHRGGAARGRRPRRRPRSARERGRRSCGARSPSRRSTAPARPTVRVELGLALAANLHPDAPRLLAEAVADATPAQRGEFALRGARALGAGRSLRRTRSTSAGARSIEPAGTPPDTLARLDAELTANAWANATTIAEARERVRRAAGRARAPALAPQRRHAGDAAGRTGRRHARARVAGA